MLANSSLRHRLITACVLLAVVVGGVFGAAAYVIIETVEYQLIDMRLSRAVSQLIDNDPAGAASSSAELRVAKGAEIPQEFAGLEVGLHEVEQNGRVLQVLIVERNGQRYAVIDDVNDFERLEFVAFVSLWVTFFAGVLFALTIARAAANRIIAPLTALTQAVQQGNLTEHPQLLGARDEIGVLARTFDATASRMKDFVARERLFTADVSHELRTPLTVILGAAELLTARLEHDPELLAMAERIRRSSADAALRVSALLKLARSPEKIEREELALRALVENEIERCRPLLDGKPVVLTLESPAEVWVRATPDLAAIAIGNLLRNACYFTQRGSVRVTIESGALVVEDTGPGVPEAVRSRLFEPFVRGHDESATGSGLGLSIVQRVAEHLGWAIRLDNVAQGGSRFTLTFGPPGANLTHR